MKQSQLHAASLASPEHGRWYERMGGESVEVFRRTPHGWEPVELADLSDAGGWIAVGDDLPVMCVRVLVRDTGGVVWIADRPYPTYPQCWRTYCGDARGPRIENATHWQYLPPEPNH